MILHKPAFLCALDLESYEKLRGLLPEFYSFPFPLATSNAQMLENIRSFDEKAYFEKVDRYVAQNPIYDKGDATEKTVAWILKKMEG